MGRRGPHSVLSTSEDSDVANYPAGSSSFCFRSTAPCSHRAQSREGWKHIGDVAFVYSPDVNESTISPGQRPSLHSHSPLRSPFAHPEPGSAFPAECITNAQGCPSKQGPWRPTLVTVVFAGPFTTVLKIPACLTPAPK